MAANQVPLSTPRQIQRALESKAVRETFSSNVKLVERVRNVNTTQLARLAVIERAHLCNVIGGKRSLSLSVARKVSRALKIPLKLLLALDLEQVCENALKQATQRTA